MPVKSPFSRMVHEMKPSCINVTGNMVTGSWATDNMKQDEMDAVVNFHTKIRTYYGISLTLQHKDNRCGNVDLHGTQPDGITRFRALCDPNGSTPCCFENKCVLKTVEECRCKNCYDLRQKLHAEVSTWIPADPTCKVTMFVGEEDSCKVLRDLTICFIGESFTRQLYIALLSIIRKNTRYGPLIKQTPADKIQLCDKHYVLSSDCLPWIDENANECDNTTHLQVNIFCHASQINTTFNYIRELQGQPNSIIVLSVGIFFEFEFSYIENQILRPLLILLAKSPWPKLIWLSAHSHGLLKSQFFNHQQRKDIVQYNLKANDLMRQKGIPILDFFPMTEPVMSYDGTHYGMGVNELKAQVLLNYILEMRTSA